MSRQALRIVTYDNNETILGISEHEIFLRKDGTLGNGISTTIAAEYHAAKLMGGYIELRPTTWTQ